MPWLAYAAILLPTLFWGTSFVAIKVLVGEVSPFTVLVLRFVLGGIAYLGVLIAIQGGRPRLPRARWRRLLFVALAGSALNSVAVTFAVDYLGAGISSLVIMLVPVLTGLLAVLSGQETLSAGKVQGFLLAFAGLAIVVLLGGPGASFAGTKLIGLVLMIGGALGFAIYNVHARPLFADYTPIEVTAYVGIAAILALVPFALYPPHAADLLALGSLSGRAWLLAIGLALFSNVLAYLGWYWALRRFEATRVALFTYLIPVWGLTGSALLLGERVTWWLPAGVALVIAGIVLANRGSGAGSPGGGTADRPDRPAAGRFRRRGPAAAPAETRRG